VSIAEMQACLTRLYTNDTTRKLFYLDQDTVLDGYILTDDERLAIKALDRKMLTFFASTLRKKRKKQVERPYQLLFKLDQKMVNRCYQRYYELYPARPNTSPREEILQFGQFMEETLAGIDTLPPYIKDLVRYERLLASVDFPQGIEQNNGSHKQERREIFSGDWLAIQEGVQIETFSYNVAAIHEALQRNEEPQGVIRGKYSILFLWRSPLRAKFFGINSNTKAFLDLCDGNTTLLDVIDKLQTQFGDDSLADSITALAHRMLELGIIKVQRHEEISSVSS
jgi:hypothetical protein